MTVPPLAVGYFWYQGRQGEWEVVSVTRQVVDGQYYGSLRIWRVGEEAPLVYIDHPGRFVGPLVPPEGA